MCKLWLSFRWALMPNFDPRILRLFETGFREEARIIDNLRSAGICVMDRDPDTGRQWSYNMWGGHYSGSLDGVIKGLKESSRPHVLECKTFNTKGFKELKKLGVEKAKPMHYAQMQQYMGWASLERAYYIAHCKETDELHAERVYINREFIKSLEAKAETIIFSPTPLDKQGDSEKSMICKWCDYKELCWYGALPEINCRTCAHSTPEPDGSWSCVKRSHDLSTNEQLHVCPQHIYIPQLTPWDVIDADPETGTITYSNGVVNGPGGKSSEDLRNEQYN